MNLTDYNFNTGDEVITTQGERGWIAHICTCDSCLKRGFNEPFWISDYGGYERCIDKFTAQNGFNGYYKIGRYRFNDFDKADILRSMAACEEDLKRYKKQLKRIYELEAEYE